MDAVLDFVLKNSKKGNPQSVLDTIDSYALEGALDRKRFLMNVGPEKGLLLKNLIIKHQSKRILELGAFIGYSAVLIAMNLKSDGCLISVDPDPNSIEAVSYTHLTLPTNREV